MSLKKMAAFFDDMSEIYDEHMLCTNKMEDFYAIIAELVRPSRPDFRLLDLGCGTGLELERLFVRYPDMRVTGIDLSPGMLELLRAKFPGKRMEIICGSYFDADFGAGFDTALSTKSLHHFGEGEKRGLYAKIRAALKPGGLFILGDNTVQSQERQDELMRENAALRRENGIPDG